MPNVLHVFNPHLFRNRNPLPVLGRSLSAARQSVALSVESWLRLESEDGAPGVIAQLALDDARDKVNTADDLVRLEKRRLADLSRKRASSMAELRGLVSDAATLTEMARESNIHQARAVSGSTTY